MAAAAEPHRRGAELLIEHCTALAGTNPQRPTAYVRLERMLGDYLTRLLVGALAQRLR